MSELVNDLLALVAREDRATLAALRRGLGKQPGTAGEMFPFVIPRLPPLNGGGRPDGGWPWSHACCFIVATLFASHPENLEHGERWQRNFGASVRRLKSAVGEGAQGPERRFVALLNAEVEDVDDYLRPMVGLLRAHAIPVDWEQLLTDLVNWGSPSRWVQTRWAKSFWQPDLEPASDSSDDA